MKPEIKQLLVTVGVLALAAVVIWRITRAGFDELAEPDTDEGGTQQGGALVGISDAVLGQPTFSRTVRESTTSLSGAATPAGKVTSNPLDGITGGIIDPQNGGSVDRALWSTTVRWRAEIVNANSRPWTGVVRFDVLEDYLVGDTRGTYSRNVTVGPREAVQIDVDYQLQGGVHIREPDLVVTMLAGSKVLQRDFSLVVT